MIKNTDLFYTRAAEYQEKRKGIMDNYKNRMEELERAKGSRLYIDEAKKAEDTRSAALEELKNEYLEYFRISLKAMETENENRGLTPPTPEQIAILQVLKMHDVAETDEARAAIKKELDRAANSCKNNAMAISVINEIATKNGLVRHYLSEDKELTAESVSGLINLLKTEITDFMNNDTSRAARLAAEHHAALYGNVESRPLPLRPLFDDKAGCFNILTHGQLAGEVLTAFCKAVDGAESTAD